LQLASQGWRHVRGWGVHGNHKKFQNPYTNYFLYYNHMAPEKLKIHPPKKFTLLDYYSSNFFFLKKKNLVLNCSVTTCCTPVLELKKNKNKNKSEKPTNIGSTQQMGKKTTYRLIGSRSFPIRQHNVNQKTHTAQGERGKNFLFNNSQISLNLTMSPSPPKKRKEKRF
jgi:hypothetical protein